MSTVVTPNKAIASMLAQGVMAAYADDPNQLPPGFSSSAVRFSAAEYSLINGYEAVPFGFAATNGKFNIVVFRGTVASNPVESWDDIYSWGNNGPCVLPPNGNFGSVNAALLSLYTGSGNGVISLSASVQAALKTLPNPNLPLFVAGHSLGGPMSTFAALDIYANVSKYAATMQLYTFASLHVGDQSFATAFSKTGIVCFRFANLSDFVPSLTGVSADTTVDPYVHVGLPCTFVWQTWGDWGNHSMANIYQPTINNSWSVIQYGDLSYPASVQQ